MVVAIEEALTGVAAMAIAEGLKLCHTSCYDGVLCFAVTVECCAALSSTVQVRNQLAGPTWVTFVSSEIQVCTRIFPNLPTF